MRRVDALHPDYPFAGSRMLQGLLLGEGYKVGRLHVRTVMKRMGIEANYRRPNTSKPAPGHKIYPYLLRHLAVTRSGLLQCAATGPACSMTRVGIHLKNPSGLFKHAEPLLYSAKCFSRRDWM